MSIAVLSQSEPSTPSAVPHDRRQGNSRGLTQAYELRDLAANAAIALKEDMTGSDGKLSIKRDEYGKPIDAQAIAQLIRAWSEAREAIRILRGRPLPGSLRPERKPSKAKRKSPAPVFVPPLSSATRESSQPQVASAAAPQPATPPAPEKPE